jgi:hypothetical protein
MDETIIARGQSYKLQQGVYWHLVDANIGALTLLNNAFLAEGLIASISEFRRFPGLENATGPYALRAAFDPKEIVWETTRTRINPDLPSRNGSLYVFDRREIADAIGNIWFGEKPRHLVEARIVDGARVCRVDAKCLNCHPADWQRNAERYWSGEMSADPIPEILVDGWLYFPRWEHPLFGQHKPAG